MSKNPRRRPNDAPASKTPSQIQSLAQAHTEAAINALVDVVTSDEASDASRVAAANALLDRGWGKPSVIAGEDEAVSAWPSTIKRVIVEGAGNPDVSDAPPAAR